MSARAVAAADVLIATIVIVASLATRDELLSDQVVWVSVAALAVVVSLAIHVTYLLRLRLRIAALATRYRGSGDG